MKSLRRSSLVALLLVLAVGWSDVSAAGAEVVFHGPRDDKVIALTFDDGWSTPRCSKILDILMERRVPATFFPNALYVRRSPDFWRRVARLGFPLGNHTTNHRDLVDLSMSDVFKEFDRDREIVEEITGVPMIRVARPPFGSYDKRTLKQAAAAGFPTLLLWDVASRDTSGSASDRAILKASLTGRNGSVIVLHCGPKVTPRILPRIIDAYEARGFRFVTVPTLLGLASPTRTRVERRPLAWAGHRTWTMWTPRWEPATTLAAN